MVSQALPTGVGNGGAGSPVEVRTVGGGGPTAINCCGWIHHWAHEYLLTCDLCTNIFVMEQKPCQKPMFSGILDTHWSLMYPYHVSV